MPKNRQRFEVTDAFSGKLIKELWMDKCNRPFSVKPLANFNCCLIYVSIRSFSLFYFFPLSPLRATKIPYSLVLFAHMDGRGRRSEELVLWPRTRRLPWKMINASKTSGYGLLWFVGTIGRRFVTEFNYRCREEWSMCLPDIRPHATVVIWYKT